MRPADRVAIETSAKQRRVMQRCHRTARIGLLVAISVVSRIKRGRHVVTELIALRVGLTFV
jgi:hypothetical protein